MKATSVNEMVRRCEGLINTKHVTEWESTFLQSISRQSQGGKDTSRLSEKQLEVLERIHEKHFA